MGATASQSRGNIFKKVPIFDDFLLRKYWKLFGQKSKFQNFLATSKIIFTTNSKKVSVQNQIIFATKFTDFDKNHFW